MATVALVGTLDTKGPDYAFLAGRLRASGAGVIVVDAGTGTPAGITPDIPAEQVAAAAGTTIAALRSAGDRGTAVTALGRGAAALVSELAAAGRVDGVLAAGGSGGSSIAAQVMAALPVGLPKLLVSTMASGDVSPYVGAKDVCVMYSVVDVAGVNRISRLVIGNAAAAMAGMALARAQAGEQGGDDERPLVAASMFGVTTPAVETARSRLTGLGYEVLVFHATGAGGRALEALAEARLLAGVLDVTTTELADDLVGGVLSDRAAGLHPAPGRRLRRLDAVTRIAIARHSNVLTRRPGRADRRRYGGPAVAVAPQGYFWSTLMWNLTWLSFTEVTVSVRPSLVPSLARSWHRILVPSTAFRSPGQVIDFGRWPTVLVSSSDTSFSTLCRLTAPLPVLKLQPVISTAPQARATGMAIRMFSVLSFAR